MPDLSPGEPQRTLGPECPTALSAPGEPRRTGLEALHPSACLVSQSWVCPALTHCQSWHTLQPLWPPTFFLFLVFSRKGVGRTTRGAPCAISCTQGRGCVLRRQEQLLTCALRPAAIYGPGETRHFPRIMRSVRQGLLRFRIGRPSAKVDWVHVDNLVHAHLLAMAALLHPPTRHVPAPGQFPEASTPQEAEGKEAAPVESKPVHAAAGQAFFISDGEARIEPQAGSGAPRLPACPSALAPNPLGICLLDVLRHGPLLWPLYNARLHTPFDVWEGTRGSSPRVVPTEVLHAWRVLQVHP